MLGYMGDAPESLGKRYIELVKARKGDDFRQLVGNCLGVYLFGAYTKQLLPEEQEWVIINRPVLIRERDCLKIVLASELNSAQQRVQEGLNSLHNSSG